jgi:hypothetical protein
MTEAFEAGKLAGIEGYRRTLATKTPEQLRQMAMRVRQTLVRQTPAAATHPKHAPGYPAYSAIKAEFARRR